MPETIYRTTFSSPLGRLGLACDGTSLTRLTLPTGKRGAAPPDANDEHPLLAETCRQLADYFAGRLQNFDLPLAPVGSDFERQVWRALCEIGFAETTSYGKLAARIGRPTASRAVGAANGRNPIAIVIPCHRVIGADGSLTGYGGGLEVKRWLLDHEARVAQGTANRSGRGHLLGV
jgi:methylated-DNA-[protein]-cysteine S-methyltransferase